ncbi:MAG: acetylxylan esterase [Planctomycetia bacterium]|nr:acetylxylan esterase [Planctomycetia bacterium]
MRRSVVLSQWLLSAATISLVLASHAFAQQQQIAPPNYDESKVPAYELPDPLVAQDGQVIDTVELWTQKRRPEILELFKHEMFGVAPEADLSKIAFEETKTVDNALGGKAIQKEVRVYFDAPNPTPCIDLLIFIPKGLDHPAPAFLMPNFQGNQTTTDETSVTAYEANDKARNKDKDLESLRGVAKSRWAFEKIIDRGYAIATCHYEQIDPDYDDGFKNGVHPLFKNFDINASDYTSTIGAWAWGLSRALDCLETIPEIDAKHVIIAGHSRLGKTALWCGASDERFAGVISNDSGCGGAALSRREFGERVDRINASFPHWFTKKFHEYGDKVNELPIDEHELIALIAPRPVYVASAQEDQWADPKGEFLSALNAEPVYALFGLPGLGVTEQPEVNTPVGKTIRYHVRTGGHDVTDYDWEQYLNFADEEVVGK